MKPTFKAQLPSDLLHDALSISSPCMSHWNSLDKVKTRREAVIEDKQQEQNVLALRNRGGIPLEQNLQAWVPGSNISHPDPYSTFSGRKCLPECTCWDQVANAGHEPQWGLQIGVLAQSSNPKTSRLGASGKTQQMWKARCIQCCSAEWILTEWALNISMWRPLQERGVLSHHLYLLARAGITKYLRLEGLNNKKIFLTVLSTRSLRSRCRQDCFLQKPLSLALDGCILPLSSHGLPYVPVS